MTYSLNDPQCDIAVLDQAWKDLQASCFETRSGKQVFLKDRYERIKTQLSQIAQNPNSSPATLALAAREFPQEVLANEVFTLLKLSAPEKALTIYHNAKSVVCYQTLCNFFMELYKGRRNYFLAFVREVYPKILSYFYKFDIDESLLSKLNNRDITVTNKDDDIKDLMISHEAWGDIHKLINFIDRISSKCEDFSERLENTYAPPEGSYHEMSLVIAELMSVVYVFTLDFQETDEYLQHLIEESRKYENCVPVS